MSNAGLHDRLGECLCGQILIYHALGGVFVLFCLAVCCLVCASVFPGGAGASSVSGALALLFLCLLSGVGVGVIQWRS